MAARRCFSRVVSSSPGSDASRIGSASAKAATNNTSARAAGDRVQRSQKGAAGGACQVSLNFQFVTKFFERLKQLVRAAISLFAIFTQRLADDLLKLSGSVCDVTS